MLYIALFPAGYRRWLTNSFRTYATKREMRGVIGPIRLILSDELFVEITETTRSEAKWRDMAGIEEVDGYTFILVTGMTAVIIPRKAFMPEEDYYRVRDFARARRVGPNRWITSKAKVSCE